jgi:hypothetical protein
LSLDKPEVAVDTNVAVVANGMTEQASSTCEATCIETLSQIRQRYRTLLDDKGLIFGEYQNNLNFSGEPGPGDAFFKWLWENQANERYCRKVPIAPHEVRGYEEFPDDPCLTSFDMDDRKYVAVAMASGSNPQVFNASDPGWWHHRESLDKHGVAVVFLCPELMS